MLKHKALINTIAHDQLVASILSFTPILDSFALRQFGYFPSQSACCNHFFPFTIAHLMSFTLVAAPRPLGLYLIRFCVAYPLILPSSTHLPLPSPVRLVLLLSPVLGQLLPLSSCRKFMPLFPPKGSPPRLLFYILTCLSLCHLMWLFLFLSPLPQPPIFTLCNLGLISVLPNQNSFSLFLHLFRKRTYLFQRSFL